MKLTFYKFQGTGNDFVMIDNREKLFDKKDTKLVAFLCDRRFGIGADGLILLENEEGVDFKMVYFNSDGNESSMCGNGGRCLVAFASYLNIIDKNATFNAVDGLHHASIFDETVSLQMKDVSEIKRKTNATFLDTGSPHHVQMVENLKDFGVKTEGEKIRYGIYGQKGSNINFVEQVDDETFSAGNIKGNLVKIKALGGDLEIKFENTGNHYSNVFLTGPAKFVFKGEIDV